MVYILPVSDNYIYLPLMSFLSTRKLEEFNPYGGSLQITNLRGYIADIKVYTKNVKVGDVYVMIPYVKIDRDIVDKYNVVYVGVRSLCNFAPNMYVPLPFLFPIVRVGDKYVIVPLLLGVTITTLVNVAGFDNAVYTMLTSGKHVIPMYIVNENIDELLLFKLNNTLDIVSHTVLRPRRVTTGKYFCSQNTYIGYYDVDLGEGWYLLAPNIAKLGSVGTGPSGVTAVPIASGTYINSVRRKEYHKIVEELCNVNIIVALLACVDAMRGLESVDTMLREISQL